MQNTSDKGRDSLRVVGGGESGVEVGVGGWVRDPGRVSLVSCSSSKVRVGGSKGVGVLVGGSVGGRVGVVEVGGEVVGEVVLVVVVVEGRGLMSVPNTTGVVTGRVLRGEISGVSWMDWLSYKVVVKGVSGPSCATS